MTKDNKKTEQGIMNTLNKSRVVGINHSFNKGLLPQHLHQIVLHSPGFYRIKNVGQQDLRLKGVLQVIRPCPKCGKNHSGDYHAGKERCFGCGQSLHRLKDFPYVRQGKGCNNNRDHSIAPATPTSLLTQQGASFVLVAINTRTCSMFSRVANIIIMIWSLVGYKYFIQMFMHSQIWGLHCLS